MEILKNNKIVPVLVILIVADTIFGILRSFKQHSTNSTIGIDGIIRKVAMILVITISIVLDYIWKIDLICFIPEILKENLNLGRVGVAELFGTLFCVFEILSVFKNLIKLGVPLPLKLKKFLERLLKEFTSEIKEGETK